MAKSLFLSGATIDALLSVAAGQLATCSDSAQLDSEVLLCHVLQKNRSYLRAWPKHLPAPLQIDQFEQLIKQRSQGMPIAYLTGQKEFWSRPFIVNPHVLIPRPDSELLVELSLALLPADTHAALLDLGTGSGILALTLATERPHSNVTATDISLGALEVAQLNAKTLGIQNVHFLHSDWFEHVAEASFDLIVSNPPYIAAEDPHLQQGDVRFEPETALISSEGGLEAIRKITAQAGRHLKNHGHLLIEHGYQQQAQVQDIFKQYHFSRINTHRDLSGNPRVTSGVWSPV